MNALDTCIELAVNISPADSDSAKTELDDMRKQLAEANEIILMTSAAVNRDEVEDVQSRALDYVQRWEVE